MRIFHTADWHLGIKLYDRNLSADHEVFFDWLIATIKERRADALLISGDIFHQANPSTETRQQYYTFLKRLIELKCTIIITGGNHDSPGVLNGPKEILSMLDVMVVGNAQENLENEIIELKNDQGNIECVVCAVPYLRDSDIRIPMEGESYKDKLERRKEGIFQHYQCMAEICREKYPAHIPIIAMGHLFAAGAATSDSEREITIGNLSDFDATAFPSIFSYIALGHIHKPQKVAGKENIRYSGSPIPLSFSEKIDKKQLIELNINGSKIDIQSHFIPGHRLLKKYIGSLEQVTNELKQFKEPGHLKAFADLEIIMTNNDPSIQIKVNELKGSFTSDHIEIVNCIIRKQKSEKAITELFDETKSITELSPLDVLKEKLIHENVSEEDTKLIVEAFQELLVEINDNV